MRKIFTRFCESKISQNLINNRSNGGVALDKKTKRSRGSILEIKLGFCETSDEDRT